jgi:HSP20 family molecular chaperone IbpA
MAEHDKAIEKAAPQTVAVSGESDSRRQQEWTYRPNVDVIDAKEEYLVVADIPGAAQNDIDITFQEDVLSIQAPVSGRFPETAQFHRQEYGVGGFHRRFVVEAPVDADKMTADFEHGVLTVHLPKAEKAKGRRVPVKGG